MSYINLNKFGEGLIKLINVATFLYVISITALVIPSFLPFTVFIGILLLIGGNILSLSPKLGRVNNKNRIEFIENINFSNILTPIIGISLLFVLFLIKSFSPNFNFISSFASLVLHTLFLVFVINTRNYLLIYIRSYIYLVFIMALFALFGFSLLNLGIVSADSNFVNISELTGGAFTRDIYDENSYIFPFYSGLILTGSGQLNLFGLSNFRISGWAHEPTSAALFVAPAMILLLHTRIIINNYFRFFLLTTIATFWFFTMSLGSFLAFLIFYFFYVPTTLFIKTFPLKFTLGIVLFISLSLLFGFYVFEDLLNSSLISSKIDFNSETFTEAMKRLTFFLPGQSLNQTTALFYLTIYLIMFFFFLNVLKSFFLEKNINPFALVVSYILLHSMKGSQDSVFVIIFPFFWFYVLYFSMPTKQT